MTDFGLLPTLFYTAYVCSPIYSALRQLRICRPILEVGGSPEDLQYSGYYQKVDRNRYVLFTGTFKRITNTGSMMRFPVHKGYYGKPTHHTGVSYLKWLLISKLLNPRPAAPGQDALGLITIYPRPDELRSSLLLPITHHSQPPSIPPFFQGFDPASTAAFPIQEHLTIRCGGCQHNHKINRITVYPFMLLKGTNG